MNKTRRELAHRRRRIIYNDDGDSLRMPAAKNGEKAFLDERFNLCLNTQVDSYFWCVGNGFDPPYGVNVPAELGDPNRIIINAARKAGMEIFASMRMNDTHDSVFKEFLPLLKIERSDLLVAEERQYPLDSVLHLTWTAFDYAKDEVRKIRTDFIESICRKYDWDGIELDFCRFRRYFKIGEEEKNSYIMTDFIGQIRDILDSIGTQRERPYLLAVRVPEHPLYCRKLGLDIEQWLSDGYIDVLIAGDGLKPFSFSLKQLIELGHNYDIPVYSCISASQFEEDNTGDSFVIERFRAAASNRWLDNPDGIYLFNVCCILNNSNPLYSKKLSTILGELGEQQTLEGLDKLYMSEAFPGWADWQYNISPYLLPVRLIDWVPLPMMVGDEVEKMADAGRISELLLRVRIDDILDEESVDIRLNGEPVKISGRINAVRMKISVWENGGGTWFEACVNTPPLHSGENEIQVCPSLGCWGKLTTLIREVQLAVRYSTVNISSVKKDR